MGKLLDLTKAEEIEVSGEILAASWRDTALFQTIEGTKGVGTRRVGPYRASFNTCGVEDPSDRENAHSKQNLEKWRAVGGHWRAPGPFPLYSSPKRVVKVRELGGLVPTTLHSRSVGCG